MYFNTQYQEVIYKSRYAKWRDDLGRREHWPETVDRYFNFFEEHLQKKCKFILTKALRKELEDAVLNLEVMPSMRALMTAGPALERCNVAGYNCSYVAIDNVRAFDEILYVLMCGTGVGFSVEHKDVDKLPIINEHFEDSSTVIVVDDSKQGWAKGLRELIAMLYVGQIPTWDLSKLRPAGARLKTFGGRSSGPEPLNDLFKFVVNKLTTASGRRLTALECHDIVCKIGEVVVVGGVRRSALISLSNLNDRAMQESKSGRWWELEGQRALANNSAVYSRIPDVTTFIEEWNSLIKSQSGERGIFNRQAAIHQVAKSGRRDITYRFGTNPCVPGDTLILTNKGHIPIIECVDKETVIWNGDKWSNVTPFSTGYNETVIVNLSNNTNLRCTPYHKFILDNGKRVDAQDLVNGDKLAKFDMPIIDEGEEYAIDAYSQGFYSGDGNAGYTFSYVYKGKYGCIPRLIGDTLHKEVNNHRTWKHGAMLDKAFVPINGSKEYCLNWLAGICDSDGCITHNTNSVCIQIDSIDRVFLDSIRLMLSRLGCQANINKAKIEGQRSMPNGNGGYSLYQCQQGWRLLITAMDVSVLKSLGFKTERLDISKSSPQRDARRFVRVVSVEEFEPCETYCFTEPFNNSGTFNGIVTAQCGEILLRPNEFCNLTEVIIREADTQETLTNKVRIATILGTFQSSLTDFKYLRKVWKENVEEERLLGVSLTGIFDNKTNWDLDTLKQHSILINKEYAKVLDIPQSVAITCVKPSGTVSQLVDSSSGIHPRHSMYYIRTIRADYKDPLTKFLIDSGIPNEPDVTKPLDTVVFSFPQKAPLYAKVRDKLTAIEHLKVWLKFKQLWCEHNPSVTISVKPDEWLDVGAWVYKNFDEVLGISFLPHTEHTYKQAPYQDCTKEQYEELVAKMPIINWDKLMDYEKEDNTISQQTLACVGNSCEIG